MMFHCKALTAVRELKLDPMLNREPGVKDYKDFDKLKWLLTKENIKEFSKIFACIYQARKDIHFRLN